MANSREKHMPNFNHIYSELYKYIYDRNYQPNITSFQLEGMSYEITDLEKDLKFRDTIVEMKEKLIQVLEC